jgi:CRP-like cAMP-binding protein
LLAVLPAGEIQRLYPLLHHTPLKFRQVLHRKGEQLQYVYFPGGGICSLVTPLDDGSTVEMAMVGREGLVGALAPPAAGIAQETALVHIGTDSCHRMALRDFRREMERRGPLSDLVTRYAQATFAFVMQSVACNAVHPVERRLCRWLLMAHDRVDGNEFPLTQELVATMLGISRPTVTIVAGTLRDAGLINYRHGRMTILKRRSLESASCECYRVVQNAFHALVPELVKTKIR